MTTETAIRQARKYSTHAAALRAARGQRALVRVILGCDGRFWTPACPAHETILVRAGYDFA